MANSNSEVEKKSPHAHVWKDKLDAKMKHLEMVQAVVTRMANNSFMIKGWCITLVSALLAFAIGKEGNPWLIVVSFLPVLMFWYLDGYFLQQERLFRRVYDRQILTENTTFEITPPEDLTDKLESVGSVMWSKTLKPFYLGIMAIVLIATAVLILVRAGIISVPESAESGKAKNPAITARPSPSQVSISSSATATPSPVSTATTQISK